MHSSPQRFAQHILGNFYAVACDIEIVRKDRELADVHLHLIEEVARNGEETAPFQWTASG